MKFKKNKKNITVRLNKDEQLTFLFKKSNYDIAKKNWGYYISPSLQTRCLKAGLKGVIISNQTSLKFAFVHKSKIKIFLSYVKSNNFKVVSWIYTPKHFSKFFNKR
tara:strand:+ start:2410 stop:2727 length:318 start_codon:yes stop_codon:yes gene_type:complete